MRPNIATSFLQDYQHQDQLEVHYQNPRLHQNPVKPIYRLMLIILMKSVVIIGSVGGFGIKVRVGKFFETTKQNLN